MKTYDERCKGVTEKIAVFKEKRKRNRRILVSVSCLALAVLALVLFVPYNTAPPDVSMYADSPYYGLIQKINEATYQKPRYDNNFQMLTSELGNLKLTASGKDIAEALPVPDEDLGVLNGTDSENAYVEVTDNQVAGVTEGDLLKRTERYFFYLNRGVLKIYSVAGEDSRELSQTDLSEDTEMWYFMQESETQMYLSQDGTILTLVAPCHRKTDKKAYVSVRSFDVSDPEKVIPAGQVFVTGSAQTSRMVDGSLLLISRFGFYGTPDFSDEANFLPQIGVPGDMHSVAAEDILSPETLSNTHYTVVTKLDAYTLEVRDTAAFLSYSDQIYVSRENIFATRRFTESGENDNSRTMSEISCLSCAGETLDFRGSVTLEGSVKNQYSMDERDGILRVVTSVSNTKQIRNNGDLTVAAYTERSASLYCVSLEDFRVVAAVERFAPEGEQAESVRFDGDYAYVCTAVVWELTDPVFFFDLSDLNNITYKDTGTIDGYSSSLVNFGDGFLLGIGFSGNRGLKIEIYAETQTGVESVCSYEAEAGFSGEYKAYLIDRENRLVGLGIDDWYAGETQYLLLFFDGYKLREAARVPLDGVLDEIRAVRIDEYLYLFADEFKVEKL